VSSVQLYGYTRSVAYLLLSCLVTRGWQWRVFCLAVRLHEDGSGGSSAQLFGYTRSVGDLLLSCLNTRGWQWRIFCSSVWLHEDGSGVSYSAVWVYEDNSGGCQALFCPPPYEQRQGFRSSETLRGVDWLSTFGMACRSDFQGLLTACCWPYCPKLVTGCMISKTKLLCLDRTHCSSDYQCRNTAGISCSP
jgi:hypothetical protein